MWVGLDKLLELQKLDLTIARLDAEARAIPQTIAAIEGRLAKAQQEFEEATEQAGHLQRERRAKERELEEANQNTKKKQTRLYEIKTNEEYTAVLKEIEVLKARSSRLETEILEQMEQGDVTAKTVTEAERVFKTEQAGCEKERQDKEARLAAIQKELADLQTVQKGQASRLDAELLKLYTRLIRNRDVAVVPVMDSSCQGCGMALTPQAYAELRRNDRMFTCASCSRILYFPG